MDHTLAETKSTILELGRKHKQDDEDSELYESTAVSLILDFFVSNKIKIPDIDLYKFSDDEDLDPSWFETFFEILARAENDAEYLKKLPKQFLELAEWLHECFGWGDNYMLKDPS